MQKFIITEFLWIKAYSVKKKIIFWIKVKIWYYPILINSNSEKNNFEIYNSRFSELLCENLRPLKFQNLRDCRISGFLVRYFLGFFLNPKLLIPEILVILGIKVFDFSTSQVLNPSPRFGGFFGFLPEILLLLFDL